LLGCATAQVKEDFFNKLLKLLVLSLKADEQEGRELPRGVRGGEMICRLSMRSHKLLEGLQGVLKGKQTVGVGGLVEVCGLVEEVLH
jgi:hypothetical protein